MTTNGCRRLVDASLTSKATFGLLAFVIHAALFPGVSAEEICVSPTNTFTAVVDLFGGELGYFTFKECPGLLNPTIGIELGQTYTFDQSDRSNWYHPLGFAYFPDGAHDDKDELERIVTLTDSDCVVDMSCPAPLYHLNGEFLGVNGTSDFGLDVYEPNFFLGVTTWVGTGNYSITLNFDDADYTQDIFYFCHIHQFMTGRIKILSNATPIATANEPPLGYEYNSVSEFDQTCGTYGLDQFQLPNAQCLEKFVCVSEDATPEFKTYSSCIDAMNCHMMAGMTTGVSANSPIALFLHQMIPHHQNAVNMAKVLLHRGNITCDDLTDEEDPMCIMESLLRDIVNTQNFQIQTMLGVLETMKYNTTDDCSVLVSTERQITDAAGTAGTSPVSTPTSVSAPPSSGEHGVARMSGMAISSAVILLLVLFV